MLVAKHTTKQKQHIWKFVCHANEVNKSGTEEEGEVGGQAGMYVCTM